MISFQSYDHKPFAGETPVSSCSDVSPCSCWCSHICRLL